MSKTIAVIEKNWQNRFRKAEYVDLDKTVWDLEINLLLIRPCFHDKSNSIFDNRNKSKNREKNDLGGLFQNYGLSDKILNSI